MSDTTTPPTGDDPTPTPPPAPAPEDSPTTIQDHLDATPDTVSGSPVAQFAVPENAPEDSSKGYAIYDRTVGQFLPGVVADRPKKSDADKAVPDGHVAAVVRV